MTEELLLELPAIIVEDQLEHLYSVVLKELWDERVLELGLHAWVLVSALHAGPEGWIQQHHYGSDLKVRMLFDAMQFEEKLASLEPLVFLPPVLAHADGLASFWVESLREARLDCLAYPSQKALEALVQFQVRPDLQKRYGLCNTLFRMTYVF